MVVDATEVSVVENPNAAQQTAESDRASIAFTVPNDLKVLVDKAADAGEMSTAAYVRNLVAQAFNFTIPSDFGTRQKYGTDEERKAAIKAKAQKRNQLMKLLMKEYRAGNIDLNDLLDDDDE